MTDDKTRSETLQAAVEMEPMPGEVESLEEIFQRHHGLVFRAAYRVTGNAVDAEDVLQTVFLRLARRPPEAGKVDGMESYLYRAAVNSALDVVRRRRTTLTMPLESAAATAESSLAGNPARAFSDRETRQWLRAAIARLSPTAAEMFVLRFFEDKENPEIARLLGTTVATVAVTLHRTRERLLREFQARSGGGR
ncbi:MAG: sigma-70 family RNA polymerase sigma factor [Bryobacteraceae bacterium]|nr:sigma-70 family RNA polymerase sigma factor [Bryobacteraceae bacterium]